MTDMATENYHELTGNWSTNGPFSIAMLNDLRVTLIKKSHPPKRISSTIQEPWFPRAKSAYIRPLSECLMSEWSYVLGTYIFRFSHSQNDRTCTSWVIPCGDLSYRYGIVGPWNEMIHMMTHLLPYHPVMFLWQITTTIMFIYHLVN